MKINLFKKKPALNKQTVTKLNKEQMNTVIGGADTVRVADSISAIDTTRSIDTLYSKDTLKS